MNKTELIDLVAQKAKLTKKDSGKVVNALLSCIADELAIDGKVRMTGFGTFKVKERKARMGKNPRTKKPVPIPASKTVVFKTGKELKVHVN